MVMNMHNMKLVVRWDDAGGKSHRKEYNTDIEARKARSWLLKNNAKNVDIAIIKSKKVQKSS